MDPAGLLVELIQARSPSTEEDPAREVLEAALRGLGLELEVDRAGNLYARKEGQGPEITLTGHMDVVPAGNEAAWPVPPFAGTVKDGFLWGRGAVDMKGALAAMVAAASELVRTRYSGSFSLLFVGAEELGGAGSRFAAGWVRPAVFVLGEPSRLRLMRGHRGRIEPHLVFTGRQGHAAFENPENPLYALGEALSALKELELGTDPDTGKNTCQPTRIEVSPNAINVVPGRVELTLDCRYGPGVGAEGVLAAVRGAAAGAEVRVPEREVTLGEVALSYPFDFPPYVLASENPWLQRALSALGQKEALLWPFTTDAPYLAATGAPVLGFGPGDPSLAHTTEERIALNELREAAHVYARLVRALGGSDAGA